MPLNLEIASLQAAYASGSLTPTDVVEEVYKRCSAYTKIDSAVWIDTVPKEQALAAATALVEKYSGKPLPPLYGVPFSVKNSLDVAGYLTTLACPSFAYMATRTAPAITRILEAGGLLIGTTNLDQFATVSPPSWTFTKANAPSAPAPEGSI
jgi:allophanate hydrolase